MDAALRKELCRCSDAASEASRATRHATAAALVETPTELMAEILTHDHEVPLTAPAPRWTHRQPDPDAAGRHRIPAPRTSNEVAVALGAVLLGRLPGEVSIVQQSTVAPREKRPPDPRVRPAQRVIDEYQLSVSGEVLCGFGERPNSLRYRNVIPRPRQPQPQQPGPQHCAGSAAAARAAPPPTPQAARAADLIQTDPPGHTRPPAGVSRFRPPPGVGRRFARPGGRLSGETTHAPRWHLNSPPKRPATKRPTTAPATRPVHTVSYHSSRWAGVESRALDLAGAHKPRALDSQATSREHRSRRAASAEDLEVLPHGQPLAGLVHPGFRSAPRYGTKRDPGGWLEVTTAWGAPIVRPYARRR